MLTVCAGGAVVPSCHAKFSVNGLAEIVGVAETVSVMGTVTDVAPPAESVMAPLSAPVVVRPDVLIETLMELELDIVTCTALELPFNNSHAPPDGVAVTLSPVVPPILSGDAAGAEVPSCQVKFSEVGVGVMVGCVTLTVIGTTIGVVTPMAEIVTEPWYMPAPAVVRTEVSTETLMVPGVVPAVLSIFTHDPPVVPAAAAVKLIPLGVELTEIDSEAGAGLPI